jgi:hypothetical protein
MRFLASSQMSSPCISYLGLQLSLLFCRVSSHVWASFLASSRVQSLLTAVGAMLLRNLTFTIPEVLVLEGAYVVMPS